MRSIILLFLLSLPALLLANPPLGDPNEVWVDCSSGDTIVVGEAVTFRLHFANADSLEKFLNVFMVYSTDGATYEWVAQNDTLWPMPNLNILSQILPHRFWGEALEIRLANWGWQWYSDSIFWVTAYSLSQPNAPPGSLQPAIDVHLRPLSTGTICIDSAYVVPDVHWHYWLTSGGYILEVNPSWNGPFCFTVIEPPAGDVNCDGQANVADAVYLINWIFKGGDPPCN